MDIYKKWKGVGGCDIRVLIDAYLQEKQTSGIFITGGTDAS